MAERPHIVDKEMGYTHADFLRLLPKAVGTADIRVDGPTVEIRDGVRRLRLDLAPETVRRLGHFRLPVTRVRLSFFGYGEAEREAALERFWRAYQKGGG